MTNDTIRSMSRDEVRELVEWIHEEVNRVYPEAVALAESVKFSGDAPINFGQSCGLREALAKLREIAARPVLVWRPNVSQTAHFARHAKIDYVAVRGMDGSWYAMCDGQSALMHGCADADAAKAACERHARGQA